MAYAGYAASVAESPFKLYSQSSFGSGELDFNPSCCNSKNHQPTKNHQHNVYLQQQTQQHHQKQHLHHQLQQKLVQHNSQQHHHQQQRVYITRQLILCAVMTLAIVAALCAFAPGSSATQKWSSSSVTVRQQAGNNMAPTAAVIKCQVQQGSNTVSSLCDGDVQYASGVQQHITVWRQTGLAAPENGSLAQPGMPARLDDGSDSGAWNAAYGGRRLRRQQHRKFVRLA